MLAESCQTVPDSFQQSYPLPLPKHMQASGLAQCLVAWAPMIELARERVQRGVRELAKSYVRAPFDPATIEECLVLNFAEPLLQIVTRVLVLEVNVARLQGVLPGETSRQRFSNFIDNLREPARADQLIAEYPVLVQQAAARLDKCATFVLEFLRDLCADWEHLRPMFRGDPGLLVNVRAGAGDTHRDGRSVIIASFSNGERIVYKPRSLAVDKHFQQLLQWLNEQGAEPHFRLLQIFDRGDHGWSEFVANTPCSSDAELSRFYQRQGSYLAILHTMGASDFHCENLIAAGEHPTLIDLEALFHQHPEDTKMQSSDDIASTALGFSVLGVGLLPQRFLGNEGNSGVDLAGLSNAAGQLTPGRVPRWEGTDTDEMHIVRKRVPLAGSENCPNLNGQHVNALQYAECIASGFAETYSLLLMHREKLQTILDRFDADEVRVLARTTQSYCTLLYESYHPDLLRDAPSREKHFDHLQIGVPDDSPVQRLIFAERKELLRGDVPLFTTFPASLDVWTSDGERIENYFSQSGLSFVQGRVAQLSEKDLQRQLWIVRASLATLAAGSQVPRKRTLRRASPTNQATAPEELIAAARAVGDRLQELALGNLQESTWIGLILTGDNEWRLSPLGPDLYDGLPGVVLFLAYLGKLSGDAKYSSLARNALTTLRRQLRSPEAVNGIGAFAGWGGIVYLLTHLAVLWADPSLLDEAETMAHSIETHLQHDAQLDVIGGAAGSILSILALHRCQPSSAMLRLARACGEHLLQAALQTQHGMGWHCISEAPCPLTGFAHGNAGIGYALAALAGATAEPKFCQAALAAFDYERSLYDAKHRNWPDLRGGDHLQFDAAWCHGAPGIALSRLCSLSYLSDAPMHDEIQAGLETTTAYRFGGNDSLCHGDLGNADILLSASQILRDDRHRLNAGQVTSSLLASVQNRNWICGNPLGIESPGLMTGISGIGYALLRQADPRRVPSILALHPPCPHA